jgi:hypothetical protein
VRAGGERETRVGRVRVLGVEEVFLLRQPRHATEDLLAVALFHSHHHHRNLFINAHDTTRHARRKQHIGSLVVTCRTSGEMDGIEYTPFPIA